jgi:hypothetical protein
MNCPWYEGTELAQILNISRSGVSIAASPGKEFVRSNQLLKKAVES